MKTKLVALSFGAAIAMSSVLPALAAPGDNGQGFGGCVDNLYGNATNERPSGHGVLPSQSPGPFVNTVFNEPPRNDRTRGPSMGDAMSFLNGLGVHGQDAQVLICLFP